MSDLERWRQLFREEAQRCVKELREVIVEDGPRGQQSDVFLIIGAATLGEHPHPAF